jgi:hypothetical protein
MYMNNLKKILVSAQSYLVGCEMHVRTSSYFMTLAIRNINHSERSDSFLTNSTCPGPLLKNDQGNFILYKILTAVCQQQDHHTLTKYEMKYKTNQIYGKQLPPSQVLPVLVVSNFDIIYSVRFDSIKLFIHDTNKGSFDIYKYNLISLLNVSV